MHALALSTLHAAPAVAAEVSPVDDVRCQAHDLKNQLQVIAGYCELLPLTLSQPDAAAREKALRMVACIQTAAGQSVRIAERMIAHQPAPCLTAVDLNALLVDEVGPLISELLRERINVHVEQGESVPLVQADPLGLARAVINLAQNARDALRAQRDRVGSGRITFSTSLPAPGSPVPFAVLAVADNGPGMDAATAARIWEPGWSTKDRGSNLRGYGLASVRAFAAQSGGRVDLQTEPGRGATFSLCLPAIQ